MWGQIQLVEGVLHALLQMTAVQLAIQQQKVAMGGSKGSQGGSRRRAAADPLKSFKAAV